MLKKLFYLLIITTLISGLFVTGQSFAKNLKVGDIILVEGTVELKRGNSKSWIKTTEATPIYKNDQLRTKKASIAEIEFIHGDIVLVSSSTHFVIKNYQVSKKKRTALFKLLIGKVLSKVKKSKTKGSIFKIKTPSGAASVRGTTFIVDVKFEDLAKPETLLTTVAVVEGSVNVVNKFERIIVDPSKQVSFKKTTKVLELKKIDQKYIEEAKKLYIPKKHKMKDKDKKIDEKDKKTKDKKLKDKKSKLVSKTDKDKDVDNNKELDVLETDTSQLHQKKNKGLKKGKTKIASLAKQPDSDDSSTKVDSSGTSEAGSQPSAGTSETGSQPSTGTSETGSQPSAGTSETGSQPSTGTTQPDTNQTPSNPETETETKTEDSNTAANNDSTSGGSSVADPSPTPANPPAAAIDPNLDSDNDGITDSEEATLGSNPNLADTDGDGMTDLQEKNNNLKILVNDAAEDADNDGLNNLLEITLGYNPNQVDTDADGITDDKEDLDVDGLPNILENVKGTQLNVANFDVDNDNIINENDPRPYKPGQFTDKVNNNYTNNINPGLANNHPDKIPAIQVIQPFLGSATEAGDGITDFDELMYNTELNKIHSTINLAPKLYDLHEIIVKIRTIVGVGYKPSAFDVPLAWTLNELYDPKDWSAGLIKAIAEDINDELGAAALSAALIPIIGDKKGLDDYLIKFEGLLDPDADFIRNRDEIDPNNIWVGGGTALVQITLDKNIQDTIANFINVITKDKPIYIELNPDLSLTCPFTGVLLLEAANSKLPNAALKSNNSIEHDGKTLYLCPGVGGNPIYVMPKDSSF